MSLKGKSEFSVEEIEKLKKLIMVRIAMPPNMQKATRDQMRMIGFYGRDDWGITDCQISDLDNLIKSGQIKVNYTSNRNTRDLRKEVEDKLSLIFPPNTVGEISESLIKEIQKCQKCETIIGYKKFPETSHGNHRGKYLIVSEAPGKESLIKRKYWTGVGGQILRSCALAVNTTLEELFYLTDIVKCWPSENDDNRTPLEIEIKNCSHFLTKEIEELKPRLILSLGKAATSFLLNRKIKLKNEHGKIYDYSNNETKILVMYHPSNIDRHKESNINRALYIEQLKSVFLKLKENNLEQIEQIFD